MRAPFDRRAGGVLMRAHDGRVDHQPFQIGFASDSSAASPIDSRRTARADHASAYLSEPSTTARPEIADCSCMRQAPSP
jgi:hypothetical protein